jgi:hypothetical protein
MGRKNMVTQNMIFRVMWLEVASHTVRLLDGLELEGMMNGNMEKPAVRITPAMERELVTKPNPGRCARDSSMVSAAPAKPSTGARIIQG